MRFNFSKMTRGAVPLAALLLSACLGGSLDNQRNLGGGATSATGGSVAALSFVAPTAYPAGVAANVPVMVTNNGSASVSNLVYTIDAATNTTGAGITISAASQAACASLAAKQSCQLMAQIAANPVSHPGAFTIVANNAAATQSALSSFATRLAGVFQANAASASANLADASVGLVTLPTNSAAGADGITVFYPASALKQSDSSGTPVMVTAVVTSANAGAFNTINLVDGSGNLLNFTVLSGNSGNGMSNLPVGSVVTFLVTAPQGVSQLQFKTQTAVTTGGNSTPVSTSANSNTVTLSGTTASVGILNILPNYFDLTTSYESQIITLSNDGNAALSAIAITPAAPLTTVSNNCAATLAAGATCQYTVKFNSADPVSGTSRVTVDYNNGSAASSATATANYRGRAVVAGLTITSGTNPNFDFTSRTAASSMTSQITLTNSGSDAETLTTFSPPANFSLNTTGVTGTPCTAGLVLAANASCNINLVYSNSTVTATSTASLGFAYTYPLAGVATVANSTVNLSYQTIQSQAILAITPNPVTFANIVNDGVDYNQQTVTVTNTGDVAATNLASSISGTDSTLFSTVAGGSCTTSLASGSNCTLTTRFGGATAAGAPARDKSASLEVSYTPYSGASLTTTSATLTGHLNTAQSANISQGTAIASGFAGGNGTSGTPYQVEQNSTSPTVSITITNTGAVPANGFYITPSALGNWNVSGNCGVSGTTVTLSSAGNCTLVLSLDNNTLGAKNYDLSNISMSWSDQDSPAGQTQMMSGTVYANVYVAPSIAVTTSPASNISVAPGASFTMTATLSGGYNVAAQTINAASTNPDISFTNNDCVLNSANSYTCTITANVAGAAAASTGNTVALSNSTIPLLAPAPDLVTFEIAAPVVQIALPQTGQTPTLPLAATVGMDGYTYHGVPWAYPAGGGPTNPPTRFTYGPGAESPCVIDNLTGMEWPADPVAMIGASQLNWSDALTAIATLNAGAGYCGYNDWVLPNVNELASMVNSGVADSAAWLVSTSGFANVQAANYWTSTTYAANTGGAFSVGMGSGMVQSNMKTGLQYIWPVRSTGAGFEPARLPQTGQTTSFAVGDDGSFRYGTDGTNAAGRFVVGTQADASACAAGQEVRVDQQTGLMWVQAPSATTYSWANAISTALPSSYCGYTDWRLPNINELRSLSNYGQSNPAAWLNSSGFIGVQAGSYWSSTTFAGNTSQAWSINMINSGKLPTVKAGSLYVWAVRGGL